MASTTLLEQMKQTADPKKLFVMQELAVSEMFQVIPQKNVEGGGEFFDREDELPDVDFRGINEGQDDSTGTLDPQSQALKLFGGDVKTDVGKIDMYGPGHHQTQVEMKARAMRMRYEDVFINGDADANPRQFNGLRKLLTPGSSQVISNHASAGPLSKMAWCAEVHHLLQVDPPDHHQRQPLAHSRWQRLLRKRRLRHSAHHVRRCHDHLP
jgi:hypothetical protein